MGDFPYFGGVFPGFYPLINGVFYVRLTVCDQVSLLINLQPVVFRSWCAAEPDLFYKKNTMKLNRYWLLVVLYLLSALITISGAVLKIMHVEAGEVLLVISLFVIVAFMLAAAPEIFRSKQIQTVEKVMWLVAFIFMLSISGLLYLVLRRKVIVGETPNHQIG